MPGQCGEGGPGSALTHDGFDKAADAKSLDFVPGQRGEGGPGSALTHDGNERAADKKSLDFVPGQRGKGGPGSALVNDGLKKSGKDKAGPHTIALRAKAKCAKLDALGQPGWDFKSFPRADGTGTNVSYFHPVLFRRPMSFAQAQNAARG